MTELIKIQDAYNILANSISILDGFSLAHLNLSKCSYNAVRNAYMRGCYINELIDSLAENGMGGINDDTAIILNEFSADVDRMIALINFTESHYTTD